MKQQNAQYGHNMLELTYAGTYKGTGATNSPNKTDRNSYVDRKSISPTKDGMSRKDSQQFKRESMMSMTLSDRSSSPDKRNKIDGVPIDKIDFGKLKIDEMIVEDYD